MGKKDRSQVAGVSCREYSDGVSQVQAEAEALIEDAIRPIQACQKQLDSKALHGPYGKQQMVETIYGAVADLKTHRLARIIRRRFMARLATDDDGFDIVRALIVLALPNLQLAVVANWTGAIHLAEQHHITPGKVRAFLYVKGGINRCADLYRRRPVAADSDDEDEPNEPNLSWKRTGGRMLVGMRRLYD